MLLIEVPKGARPAFKNLASSSPLTRLAGIAQTRRWLEQLEVESMERARNADASWEEIATALEVSAAQARRRYPLR
jgi:hypothetical protein